MVMKANLGKMLGRLAPMARSKLPEGGLEAARRAPRTAVGYPTRMPRPEPRMIAAPQPIVDTPENIQRMPRPQGLADAGGMLAKFSEQFRNAETAPNTRPGILGGMQPRTLTPEEAMAITSMPQQQQMAVALPPQRLGLGMQMPMMQMPVAAPQGPSSDEIMRLIQEMQQPAQVNNRTMIQTPGFRLPTEPQPIVNPNVPYRPTGPDAFYGAPPAPLQQTPQNARGMALGGLMAKYRGGMC